jgi:hypothetical protein
LEQGKALELNRVLVLKPDAALTLDFAQGARVVLRGPAQAVVAPRGEQALLLHSGAAQIDLPPSAPTQASGFWISTPSVRLELVRGGRLAVRAFSDGSSHAFVVSGSAQLAAGPAAQAPVFVAAGSGLRVALDGQVERTQVAALTLEGALERVLRLPARSGKQGSVRTSLDQSLAQLVDQVAADLAQEQRLVAAHRARIGSPAALSAQADVAVHAANLARERAQLRGLLSRRAAALLAPVPGPDDALGLRAEKLVMR